MIGRPIGSGLTPIAQRLWAKVRITPSCWLWIGCCNNKGYGKISSGSHRTSLVHRISFELMYGEIPLEQLVLHRCDVPNCVNPEHLFLGTQADNLADMDAKGRRVNANVKLTVDEVKELRSLRKQGMSVYRLAGLFNITHQAVSKVALQQRWRTV